MAELDKIRTELMNSSAITVQRYFRGYKARKGYLKRKRAVITLQARPLSDHQKLACDSPGWPFLMMGCK